MVALLTTIHVLVAVILILIILVQSARGTDVAAAFGGMGSQAAFGPRGTATFLSKATTALAIIFMLTSLSLAILANRSRGGEASVLSEQERATQTQEAAPAEGQPGIQVETETIPPAGEGQPGSPAQTETAPAEAPPQ